MRQFVLPIKDSNVFKEVQDTLLNNFKAGRRNYTIFQVGKATLLRVSDVMCLKLADIFNLKVLEPEAYKDLTQEEYRKEIKGLSFEERIDKATSLIEEHERKIERSRGYEIDI